MNNVDSTCHLDCDVPVVVGGGSAGDSIAIAVVVAANDAVAGFVVDRHVCHACVAVAQQCACLTETVVRDRRQGGTEQQTQTLGLQASYWNKQQKTFPSLKDTGGQKQTSGEKGARGRQEGERRGKGRTRSK